jgi:hypothetical protein
MLGASETLVDVVVDGAVEEEHAARQKPRTNAVKSRIMIVPSCDRNEDLDSNWPQFRATGPHDLGCHRATTSSPLSTVSVF